MEGQDFVIHLGVHGTRHSGTSTSHDRPQSARATARPLSSGSRRSRLPVTVEKELGIQHVPAREASEWLRMDSADSPVGESGAVVRLQDFFDKSSEAESKEPQMRVRAPKLVLGGAPAPKEPLSAREASSRQAEADRITVKAALNGAGLNAADKAHAVPEITFYNLMAPTSLRAWPLQGSLSQREPSVADVAAQLGARLDPVHASSNPDKFRNTKVRSDHTMSVPEELQNLSEMAHALAHGDKLKSKVAQASNVTGIIGVRRPGYNPTLRKYEQQLPKAVALYLDRGRGAISDYPMDAHAARRPTRAKGIDEDAKQPDEEDETPKPKLRPSIERLSKPAPKRSGRMEPSDMSWHLPDHLRFPHKERDFQTENKTGLWRFNRRNHEAEVKKRVSHHMSQVKRAHATMLVRSSESREQFVQKQRMREEVLGQLKRAKEIALERQAHQRIWLKHLLVYHAGQLFLHAATHGTEYDASLKANPLQDVRKSMRGLLARVRATRSDMALKGSREAQKMNTLSLIRWVFENRPLIRGEKVPALYRWVLRIRYRKQMMYISRAAAVVKDVVIAVGHVKNTLYQMKMWKNEVIKCQRMIRRALIRRDQHLFVILSHVHEYTSLHIMKEIMYGIISIFPSTSAFSVRREMNITRHKDIKVHLMRAQEVSNYERIFPGLPLWIAISLEKMSSELIKVYGAEYSINLQASRVWDAFTNLFKRATLHEDDNRELTWKIYNDLSGQCVSQWEEYFRKKVLLDARDEQQRFIVGALCDSFGPVAEKYWAEEQARQNRVCGEVQRPVFPIQMVQPNKVQEFFKEMYVQSRHEQQSQQAAKDASLLAQKRDTADAPSSKLDLEGQTELEAKRIEEAREVLLSRQRAKILARVTTKNLMAVVQQEAEPSTRDTLLASDAAVSATSTARGAAACHDDDHADHLAQSLDRRVARQHEYFNVRVKTQKVFRALLPALL